MDILNNKELLSQFANHADFANTICGGVSETRISLQNKKDHIYIKVVAPAVNSENFGLTLNGGLLVISSNLNIKRENSASDENMNLRIPYFVRTIPLPVFVDIDKIDAVHEGNAFHIKLPYKEENGRLSRNIQIREMN